MANVTKMRVNVVQQSYLEVDEGQQGIKWPTYGT